MITNNYHKNSKELIKDGFLFQLSDYDGVYDFVSDIEIELVDIQKQYKIKGTIERIYND